MSKPRFFPDRAGSPLPGAGAGAGRTTRWLAAGLLLVACATPPPAPLSPADSAATLEARRLDDPRLLAFIAAADHSSVGQPIWDLRTLSLAALYFHPDLDVARSGLALAEAGTVTAAERPNPSIALVPPPWVFGSVGNAVFESFGKRGERSAQAARRVEAARADLASASWQVRAGVRGALLDLWAAQRRRVLAADRQALEEKILGTLERRLAAGEASAPEVTHERIARNELSLEAAADGRAAQAARLRLARAIGVPARALDGIAIVLDNFDQPLVPPTASGEGALRRQALLARADLRASLANYEAAAAALRLELANRYPNLTLSPGENWYQGVPAFAIAPAIDLPILNQNQGRIGEALARRNQEAMRFLALQAQILGAIDQASDSYRAALETLQSAEQLRAEEARRSRAAASAFRAGATDAPAMLASRLAEAVSRQSRLDALAAAQLAAGALEDALQQPLFDPDADWPDPETSPRPPILSATDLPR